MHRRCQVANCEIALRERIEGLMTRKEKKNHDATQKALAKIQRMEERARKEALRVEERARKALAAEEAKRRREADRVNNMQSKRKKLAKT